ncbi:hypothetical protein Hanom_Chr07g00612101 [Helianthus anomalus]
MNPNQNRDNKPKTQLNSHLTFYLSLHDRKKCMHINPRGHQSITGECTNKLCTKERSDLGRVFSQIN